MNNKFIFLDYDGVLNSYRSDIAFRGVESNPERMIEAFNSVDPRFDPVAVGLVRRLVLMTDAKIIISSSWRKMTTLDLIYMTFAYYNWDVKGIVVGMTPDLGHSTRGYEIDQWVQRNVVDRYVILDDSIDMMEHQISHFVNTDPRVGFGYDDFHKAIKILND